MIQSQAQMALRLAIAALVGLAAGLEREWSGHATGPHARFAGLRTFFLLGTLGGVAGLLADSGFAILGGAIAVAGAAFCVVAYAMVVRRRSADADGTTEAAALAVIALGVAAGVGWTQMAAAAGALAVLMLSEKTRLHWFVRQLAAPELRAGLQFAVLAVVVLPLLPTGPYLGVLAIQPRALWVLVLVFSALNFAGYVARRAVGEQRGLGITGAIGGIVSSTAVTLAFSRDSREGGRLAGPLSLGVLAACTVLVPRVLIISAVLNLQVALAALPILAPMFVVGLVIVGLGVRAGGDRPRVADADDRNPLRLGAAIRLAVAFQVAMAAITLVRDAFGTPGVFATAGLLGATDVDALTVSMSRPEANLTAEVAGRAIAIGILVNTLVKLAIAVVVGRAPYRRRVSIGLGALALAGAAGLVGAFVF